MILARFTVLNTYISEVLIRSPYGCRIARNWEKAEINTLHLFSFSHDLLKAIQNVLLPYNQFLCHLVYFNGVLCARAFKAIFKSFLFWINLNKLGQEIRDKSHRRRPKSEMAWISKSLGSICQEAKVEGLWKSCTCYHVDRTKTTLSNGL